MSADADADPGPELDLQALRTRWLGRSIRSAGRVDSTSTRLRAWADQGAQAGSVYVAQEQTQGRGRQGRVWQSESGQGLFASILLRPAQPLPELPGLSLAVAVASAQALESAAGVEVRLKWPNDLLVGRRKLGGILLESRRSTDPEVIVGIGLNLTAPARGWAPDLAGIATSVTESTGACPRRDDVLCALLNHLEPAVEMFASDGLTPFLAAWRSRAAMEGEIVEIENGELRFEATVLGLDDEGCLRVRDQAGREHVLRSGEVHLRRRTS